MKPIIYDVNDLKDSVEVYESKPAPVIVYTIYAILLVFVSAIVFMNFFKIDDFVKSAGVFSSSNNICKVSSMNNGKIEKVNVHYGDYVHEGDTIYVVNAKSLVMDKNNSYTYENHDIKANASGYYYNSVDLRQGGFVQEGQELGEIYPEKDSEFYVQLYVKNSNIGKIKEGQEVKIEIDAYPSSEYGYFIGKVSNISKDVTLNKTTGESYYIVKVSCDSCTLKDKKGNTVYLKNGMTCSGRIIVGEKTVMTYFLEKVNLLD